MSGVDPRHFRANVVRPALRDIGLWSEAAELLVFGTAVQESGLRWLVQLGGPALGFFQMEPATHADIHHNFLGYRPELNRQVLGLLALGQPRVDQLVWNLRYAAAMCRVHYLRDRQPLPAAGDVEGMGALWKRHYNTPAGKGRAEEFVANLRRAIAV